MTLSEIHPTRRPRRTIASGRLTDRKELGLEETQDDGSIAELTQCRSCIGSIKSPLNSAVVEQVALAQLDYVWA